MNDYIDSIRKQIGHQPLLLVGAGVFVYSNSKLLLQKRRDNGMWADHGGCTEIGETLEQTASREMQEETGLVPTKLDYIGIFSGPDRMHTYPNGDQAYMIGVYYLCDQFTGELAMQAEEVLDLQWFALNDLPSNIAPLAKEPLDACLSLLRKRNVSRET